MILRSTRLLLTDSRYWPLLAALVVLGDAVLTELIIRFISYTEIDWKTYMVHVQLFLKGERDYSKITGPTGPLVYPAGHVHIYRFLYAITNSGQNILIAQHLFAMLYVLSLILTICIYRQAGCLPNWILFALPLSKRLHSIYVLRLFNDCWSVVAAQAAILALQLGMDDFGTVLFSFALSVKMSVLLYLPGLLVIFFLRGGLISTVQRLLNILSIQILLAYPFLKHDRSSYFHSAFEFSRAFLYKWTVNWRMIPENIFLSSGWARGLLLGHVTVLILFGSFRWLSRQGGLSNVLDRGLRRPFHPPARVPVTPDYVATVLFTSNLIGILFARSLHYQFYSWYAQQLPFLTWRTRYPLPLKVVLLSVIEYSWNVYPSTSVSSSALFAANSLLLLGLWFGNSEGRPTSTQEK